MANYLAMNRDELTAEKAALEAKYKRISGRGLKLNMAAANTALTRWIYFIFTDIFALH